MNRFKKFAAFRGLPFTLLSLASATMVVVAFPEYYQHYLAWIALVPLLYVVSGSGRRASFFLCFACGMLIYLWGVWWVTWSMIYFGGMAPVLAVFCLVVFSMYHALLYGFFGYVSKVLLDRGFSEFLIFPFVYSFLAFFFPTLFPWSIANSQIENKFFAQSADLWGVAGLNVFVVLANVAIHALLRSPGKAARRKTVICFLSVVSVILLLHLYGAYRIRVVRNAPALRKFKVAIIQGNLGIDMLGRANFTKHSFNTYRRLTRIYRGYDLVVWPESSVPLSYTLHTAYRKAMDDLADEVHSNIIFGSWDSRMENGERKNYSTAFLIGPGKEYQVYDKIKLLPFGDYMPMESVLPFFRKFVRGVGDYTPGKKVEVLEVDGTGIAPSICYEILIPELNRKFRARGAKMIVNMTNDAWFGQTKESYQHMGLGRFRAVELKIPIVRSTNTGVSAFISPVGQIVSQIKQNREGAISWEIPLKSTFSLFAKIGHLPLYLYFLICLGLIAKGSFIRRKQK